MLCPILTDFSEESTLACAKKCGCEMLMEEAGYIQLVQRNILVEKYLSACVLIYHCKVRPEKMLFIGQPMTKCQHSYFGAPNCQ